MEKFSITQHGPTNSTKKDINFKSSINETGRIPFLEYEENQNLQTKISSQLVRVKNVIKNWNQLFSFNLTQSTNNSVTNIKITHNDSVYQNPQNEVNIIAKIINTQTNETYRLKAYYAERNLWQINFLPPVTTYYKVEIYIHTPYTFQKLTTKIDVEKTKYNLLKISGQNFVDNQNKIFLPLGIEDAFLDRNLDGDFQDQLHANYLEQPTTDEIDFRYQTLDQHIDSFFSESKANFYRYGVDNLTPPLWYEFGHGQFVPYLRGGYFGDQLVQKLKNKDIRIMMTIFGFHPPYDANEAIRQPKSKTAIKKYLDYIVSRYSAYVDLWEIGNETQVDEEFYQLVVDYLRQIDPYQHPISTNWEEPTNPNFDYVSIHAYEPPSRDANVINSAFQIIKETSSEKPIVISELGYKQVSWHENSDMEFKTMAWLATFNQLGVVFWNRGQNGIYKNPNNANIYIGPKERQILKNLVNFLPVFHAPLQRKSFLIEDTTLNAYILSDESNFVAYIVNLGNQVERGHMVIPLPKGTNIQYIDPKTNTSIDNQITKFDNENILLPVIKDDLAIKAKLQ